MIIDHKFDMLIKQSGPYFGFEMLDYAWLPMTDDWIFIIDVKAANFIWRLKIDAWVIYEESHDLYKFINRISDSIKNYLNPIWC